jgi:hypothetical protein
MHWSVQKSFYFCDLPNREEGWVLLFTILEKHGLDSKWD